MNARTTMTKLLPVLIFAAVAISTYHVSQEMFRYDGNMAYVLGAMLGLTNAVAAFFFLEVPSSRAVSGLTLAGAVVASTWLQIRYYQAHGAGVDAYVLGVWAPAAEILLSALFAKLTAEQEPVKRSTPGTLNVLAGAMAERIRSSNSPANVQSEQPSAVQESSPEQSESSKQADVNGSIGTKQSSKEQALERLIEFYRSNPDASYSDAAETIGRSKGTVANYLNELERSGVVHRNGNGVEVLNG